MRYDWGDGMLLHGRAWDGRLGVDKRGTPGRGGVRYVGGGGHCVGGEGRGGDWVVRELGCGCRQVGWAECVVAWMLNKSEEGV